MKKYVLNFNDVKDDILSPGKILWQQKSGAEVLISAKGGFLNLDMIRKLINGGYVVVIEDDGMSLAHIEFAEVFEKYSKEIQIKEKLKWRNLFVGLLLKHYVNLPKDQEDLNQLCWKLFSEIKREEASHYLDRDIHYFKRGMSLASSFTIGAFLLGYYDSAFLKIIFSTTMRNLMLLGKDKPVFLLKENLEAIRKKPSMSAADLAFVKTIADTNNFSQMLLMEKFDGSGLMSLSTQDMNDLEILLCSLNYYCNWDDDQGKNILLDITEGRFKSNVTLMNLMMRNFVIFRENSEIAG